MKCRHVEDHLTEYMDGTLPAETMAQVAEHMNACRTCHDLMEEVRALLVTCKAVPVLEPDLDLIERILLRTSGRPRTRSVREILREYFFKPILTPRFAAGFALALLFAVFAVNLMAPKASAVVSALRPAEIFRRVDRFTQQVYGEGLKFYDRKNEWQAQFNYFTSNVFNKLGFMIERLDVPLEGKEKSGEPRQQQQKAPVEKSSILLLPA